MKDYVQAMIAEWNAERPDVDVTALEVVGRLLRAGKIVEARLDALAASVGLSHKGDLDVLTVLRRSGPPYEQSPSLLARSVQLTTGGMTNRLDRLEGSGLVSRRPDPADRRGVLVRLTEVGAAKADEAFDLVLDAQRRIAATMNPTQRAVMAEALAALLVMLGDVHPFDELI
jgi:DNA-binding MarR family transcriptional regulator